MTSPELTLRWPGRGTGTLAGAGAREADAEVRTAYGLDAEDAVAVPEGAEETRQGLFSGYRFAGWEGIGAVLDAVAAAPRATLAILQAVEEGFEELARPNGLLSDAYLGESQLLERLRRAGSAAGVVTAHSNYPVRLLRRYANELQKQAKAACAEEGLRSAVAWRLLTDSAPLTRKLEARPAGEMSLAGFESLLAAAGAAREVDLPSSALQRLLAHYRSEERSLTSLDGTARDEVLDLVAANFFRYQLALNRRARDAAGEIAGVTGTLYSAGGGGILVAGTAVPRRELVESTRRWLEERSRGLTFTVIAEDLRATDLRTGDAPRTIEATGFSGLDRFRVVSGIQGALVRTQVKMRAAKESNPRFRPRSARRHWRGVRIERCPSCGHRAPGKTPVTGNPVLGRSAMLSSSAFCYPGVGLRARIWRARFPLSPR